jgi:thymidylate synthase (FAD)
MRDRHGSPFEHNAFRFHVRCPIFVAREWFRHRIGSFNEFSMRYAKATDDFYVPEPDDVRSQVGKPGAYSFEQVTDELAEETRQELEAVYEQAYATYARLVEKGVARELARAVMRLHAVLLDRQRPGPDELRLTPQRGDGAARDPAVR